LKLDYSNKAGGYFNVTEILSIVSTPMPGAYGIFGLEGFRVWLLTMKELGENIEDIDRNIVAVTTNFGANFYMWNMRGAEGYERYESKETV
jgi:hypothetical protein